MRTPTTKDVAAVLVAKLYDYERSLDAKKTKTDAERRHIERLREVRNIGTTKR
jgi:hypothetical protein